MIKPAHNSIDMTGKQIGVILVKERIFIQKKKAHWKCLCICGKEKIYSTAELKSYKLNYCSCDKNNKKLSPNMIDITGKTFGYLTVIEPIFNEKFIGLRWLCKCKCGSLYKAKGVNLRNGHVKSCGCYIKELNNSKKGEKSLNWKGGRFESRGYVKIYEPNHPLFSNMKKKYIGEHVKVMAEYLGRPLNPGEFVHHKNGIRNDNRLENLELWTKHHPPGQRVSDMVEFCKSYLKQYAPYELK